MVLTGNSAAVTSMIRLKYMVMFAYTFDPTCKFDTSHYTGSS